MPYQTNGVNFQAPGFNPYQTNGVNYQVPGFNPYYTPYTFPTNAPQVQPQQGYSAPTPQFVPTPIHGHTIRDDSVEIPPNDVPMDGTVNLFPTEDYSCIFAKHWNKDGKITTTKFVPVPSDEDYVPTPGFEDEMRSRMDELKTLIQQNNGHSYTQQNRNYNKKPNYNRNKQNGDSDATV